MLPSTRFVRVHPAVVSSGWPDNTNTGVLGASLTTITLSGALWRETTDGTGLYTTESIGGQTYHVYSNYWFQGGVDGTYLYIDFAYIKFQTCKFTATVHISNTSAMVQPASNCVKSIYNDCTFDGGTFHQRGILDPYSDMTIRRCDFTRFGNSAAEKNNASAVGTFDVQDCYLHEVKGWDLGDHIDGLQCAGAAVVRFVHNTVWVEPYGYTDGDTGTSGNVSTSCINLAIDIGDVGDVLIDNNRISGAGYCMYVREQGKTFTGPVVVSNNYFDRTHWPSLSGDAEVFGSGVLSNTSVPAALSGGGWQSNHWEDGSSLSYATAIT